MTSHDLDPHSVLGVPPEASETEIKTAFHYLAKKFHPDLNPQDANAELWFKKIEGAYSALKNGRTQATPNRSTNSTADAQLASLRVELARALAQLAEISSRSSAPPDRTTEPRTKEFPWTLRLFVVIVAIVGLTRLLPSSRASAATSRATERISFQASCRLRAEPSVESTVIGLAQAGVAFAVLGKERGWRRIQLVNGTLGWVGCRSFQGGSDSRLETTVGPEIPYVPSTMGSWTLALDEKENQWNG